MNKLIVSMGLAALLGVSLVASVGNKAIGCTKDGAQMTLVYDVEDVKGHDVVAHVNKAWTELTATRTVNQILTDPASPAAFFQSLDEVDYDSIEVHGNPTVTGACEVK